MVVGVVVLLVVRGGAVAVVDMFGDVDVAFAVGVLMVVIVARVVGIARVVARTLFVVGCVVVEIVVDGVGGASLCVAVFVAVVGGRLWLVV